MSRPIPFELPNKAKIAVSFFVAFEAFTKFSQMYRRGGDQPEFGSLAYGEYGGKAGIWRIMDLLNKYQVKGTVEVNGLAAQKFPDAVKALHAAGHEIVGHGWSNDTYLDSLDPEKERQVIKESLDTITSLTGEKPVGWISPGQRRTEHTFRYLVEEGIFWSTDLPSDDVPYHIEIDHKPLVIMPAHHFNYANDLSLIFTPKNPPSVYFETFKSAFDFLYAEGVAGRPKVTNALVHAHLGGRPHIAGTFEECIRYAKQFTEVWFCTKAEMAKWYLERRAGK
jgi:peptidoglycan/xylan/chitin deacetylase (PgdA/CDA1 family)